MENQNEMEIDLVELFFYLKKKLWIIVASFLVCAVAGFVFSQFFITPEYTASTRLYVVNRSNENGAVTSDFQIATYVLNDGKELIKGQNVTKEVINKLNLDMSTSELSSKISVSAPDNTRILQINVTDTDPVRAADIANTVREIACEQFVTITKAEAAETVYEADVPQNPSSPNVMRNTVIAAALGLVAAVGVLAVIFIMDDTIRTEEDVERYLGLSVLGVIPISMELGGGNTANKNTRTRRTGSVDAAKKQ